MDSTPTGISKPMAFPKPPKSALFDRLAAFLPVLATENEKLEAAIACGEGDRHNIEIHEPDAADGGAGDEEEEAEDDDDSDVEMDAANSKPTTTKAPVIEMNFALGLMEEGGSDSDSDSDDDENDKNGEIDLAATIAVATGGGQQSGGAGEKELQQLNLGPAKPPATRPLIQELN